MTYKYQPPCTITPELVSLVAEISKTIGRLSARAKAAHVDSAHFVRYLFKKILEASQEAASVSEKMSEKTLRLIDEHPTITIAELAHALGVASRTIERTLKSL